mgnify:CR=1 FL=1
MLNDIYQGLDPIAFSLGPLVVRWYGLAYVLGFVCAAAIIYFVAKRWKLGMSEDNLNHAQNCLSWSENPSEITVTTDSCAHALPAMPDVAGLLSG